MKSAELAINNYKDIIIEKVENNKVVVIEAPTGSGKTTQIPQIIFGAGLDKWGMIGVTQPRRIAAYAVSKRIASEMDSELGGLVGYKIRFDDKTGSNTKIKIMTDGILLEELRSDPMLTKYSIIIVDEAHERSLNIDFTLGLLKNILKERDDFKVIISSATINAELFSQYFGNAPVISVDTKPYPVDEKYFKMKKIGDEEEQLAHVSAIVEAIENEGKPGDILIFLPGENTIKECCANLEAQNAKHNNFEVMPLYARLSPEEQNRVFDVVPDKRKIVIATNIAETSLTIDGIVHVVDPGYAKINYYNPRTFTSYLELKPISKASCDQRKGRAGRTQPGVVYRLFSADDYKAREQYTKEEIYRTDLSEVVLRMSDLGIYNFTTFDFISPPSHGAINSAIDTLIAIGSLDSQNRITKLGKLMVDFPLAPRLSRILIESLLTFPEVANAVLIVISFLSSKTPFLYPMGEEIESRNMQKKFLVKGGDFFSWINLFFKYTAASDKEIFCSTFYLDPRAMNEIVNVHFQLTSMVSERNYTIGNKQDYNKIILCLCAGLKQFICCKGTNKRSNSYTSATEQEIRIHPGSYMFDYQPDWIVGGEIVNTGRTYVRSGAMIPDKLVKLSLSDVMLAITNLNTKKKYLKEESTFVTTKTFKTEETKIQILDRTFEVIKDRNDLLINIKYHEIIPFKDRKEKILGRDYGRYIAKLHYKDRVIVKDKLTSLIQYFDKIDLSTGFNSRWPKEQSISYPEDWMTLYRYIPLIMKPTTKSKNNKKTGFLTLKYLGDKLYEYYLESDFFNALETNLNSLNELFSSDVPAWNDQEKAAIERIHRKLTEISDEIII